MKKRIAVILVLSALLFAGSAPSVSALDFPDPEGFVNDFAGILSLEVEQNLEQKLIQLEKDSAIEIAVVTVGSLEGTTVEDYAVRLFKDWGIGKKNEDNGALLLVAVDERDYRLEVGYGLEPLLTDSKAGRIGRNIIKPNFAEGNYDAGTTEAVDALIKVVYGEEVDLGPTTSESDTGDGEAVWFLLVIGSIFLSYLTSFLARSKRWWPGGIIGAVLGLILSFYLVPFLASLISKFLVTLGLGAVGLLFDFILSKNYKKRKKGGLPTSFWHSGGGFFGGSGGSGGSRGGGFGGGSSGGGGASGSW